MLAFFSISIGVIDSNEIEFWAMKEAQRIFKRDFHENIFIEGDPTNAIWLALGKKPPQKLLLLFKELVNMQQEMDLSYSSLVIS